MADGEFWCWRCKRTRAGPEVWVNPDGRRRKKPVCKECQKRACDNRLRGQKARYGKVYVPLP